MCVHSMKDYVTSVNTTSASVNVRALAKYCHDWGIRVSLLAPYMKEMIGLAERCFGTIMIRSRSMLNNSAFLEKHWPLAVCYATLFKNRMPGSALEDRSPHSLVFGYNPDFSHERILSPDSIRLGYLSIQIRTAWWAQWTGSWTLATLCM